MVCFLSSVQPHQALLPSVGLAGGSGVVFVVGTAFRAGPELACKFGDTTSQSVYMSSSLVRCHMPSLGRGKTSVQVSFDGVTYISGREFQVIEKVTLDGITPSRGPIQGSNLVTLNGAGFKSSDAYCCVFGFHRNVTDGLVVSPSSILCTAPKQSGAARVLVSLQAHGRIAVDVPMAYEFAVPALATSLEPAAGRVLGGTAITVRGQGFMTSDGAGLEC